MSSGNWMRYLKKIKPYTIKKGIRYLKHYGPKEFWVRLCERMEPEEVPYGPWFENHKPSEKELEDLLFAWKVVKHTKSNAIAIAKDKCTTGVGPGQVSRIWALENAIRQGGERIAGSVMASDAFFPFADCVEAAHKAGITAIIQPGGSIHDQDSIDAANKYNIAMIFTGMRHFKH